MSATICLINPPFGAIEHPSIGLGLLQASARRAGFSCRTLNANLAFAERLGLNLYFWFATSPNYLDFFGEWVFTESLFPETEATYEEYFRRFVTEELESTFKAVLPGHNLVETLRQTRKLAGEFIEQVAAEVVSTRPLVVGCTSSGQQNCASAALLKRVREIDNSIITLLGGPNCEGPMGQGLRRAFPWVDFVVSGDGEMIFPGLVRSLLQHGREVDEELLPEGVIGASRAAAPALPSVCRAVVWNLDATLPPDYEDYFEQLPRSRLAPKITPGLLLETSRGCWWGERRCKFCGLNGMVLKYRAKSADRIVGEIESLCSRYNTWKVMFVDNNLEPRLASEVFSRLAERPEPLCLFFETRVMDQRQLELMARGGIRWITVGIESFHPRLLALMGKGTSVLENIQVLRWAFDLGIRVSYSLMYGFPGERDEWYGEMADLLPLLHHLEPPHRIWPMKYDRFSVYHEEPQRFGLRLAPRKSYSYVYPLPPDLLADIAYFFEDENGSQRQAAKGPGFKTMQERWRQWLEAFWAPDSEREQAFLYVLPCPGTREKMLYDTRACAARTTVILSDLEIRILECCDQICSLTQIEEHCASGGWDPRAVSPAVDTLLGRKALLQQNGSYLSLAVNPPRRAYLPVRDFPGGYYSPEVRPGGPGKAGGAQKKFY
ncbi:MAG: RiPP maturation radical SAM C-methyltransferase [Syntrophales bacterium]|nr:RiPP maturation radical SAM C-methyltransferase [Syntrophales bacterium]